ncbi:PDZ domain-containing protein [Salinibacterium sp. dk2585]|uniref:S1C family serine protease n=1 Tax=unclassified Salinibacterium TaxID=2632331 RepID=UPI0011C24BE6|nr:MULTISPECIES: trypsin-like peptidase domain-containing protein [unclassified Salinibacterium]QEE61851.1 PDZ domain-containing protein [Salinibacterium sp. dk2585]TXK54594.1 PDZ domain-containing protein [Salinibacterium sp. dk5596]
MTEQPERPEDPTPPDNRAGETHPATAADGTGTPPPAADGTGAPAPAAQGAASPQGASSPQDPAPQQGAAFDAGATASPQADASPRPEPRRAGVGMVAVAAIAALVGGGVGAGVYAGVTGGENNEQGVVGTNLMINDVENATIISAVAAAVAPSVVTLAVNGGQASGSGSGVVLTEDGYILTNAHVATLSGATADPTIRVQSYDGRLFDATLVGSDPIADLAVVKVDADVKFQPAEFANSDELNVGDTTIAIGAPLGLSNTVTSGVVSALNRSITVASSEAPESEEAPDEPQPDAPDGWGPFDFWEFDNAPDRGSAPASSTIALPVIQTDAAINPGNSGGPLLDEDGKVIGINVAIASTGNTGSSTAGSIGVGFAIPSNLAQRVASELIENGTASHGLLGATVADVTDDSAIDSDVVGASIQEVTPDGAAEKAGLRPGDVVVEFEGLPITGKTDLTAQVRVLPGGTEAELVYLRDGERNTATVTLGELG